MDFSKLPVVITLTNKSDVEVGFRFFRVNFTEVLKAGESITISAQSSEEAAYYMAQADANIGLTAEVKAGD